MIVDVLRVKEIIVLDKADYRITADGYLTAQPRVGRTGIQLYKGSELGKNDMAVVRVYRPEDEVMHKDAMASIAHRPITNDHPPVPVTADNWKKYSVGQTGDSVVRDGEFVRVPMVLMDAGVIRDFNDGKKELSLGYTSNLEWRSGKTPQGDAYDAVQTVIRVNHLAVVDAARGGPRLAIGDSVHVNSVAVEIARKSIADGKFDDEDPMSNTVEAIRLVTDAAGIEKYPFMKDGIVYRSALESIKAKAASSSEQPVADLCDELITLIDAATQGDKPMAGEKQTTVNVDGVPVEMSDIAASVVLRRMKHLEQEAGDLRTKLEANESAKKGTQEKDAATIDAQKKAIETKDAEIVTLKKQVEDAKITPAKLDELVKDRSLVAGKAKVILGDKLVIDGKTISEIKRQVVDANLGEAAKGWNDDQVNASFVALTRDVKDEQIVSASDSMRATFSGKPPNAGDQARITAYDKYDKRLNDAWKGQQPAATS